MTYGLEIKAEKADLEVLSTLSFDYGCTGVLEENEYFVLYFSAEQERSTFLEYANSLEQLNFEAKEISIADQNWNETWETTFDKVCIDDFCLISTPFHQEQEGCDFDYRIIIQPKMAFGTGHHETTSGLISAMKRMSFDDKSVLDFGAGTAVLGILAEKMNANKILAVDNDSIAVENGLENLALNNCQRTQYIHSDEFSYEASAYDVIFCNITRNVIKEFLPKLLPTLKQGGTILFSGYIIQDRGSMESFFKQSNLEVSNFIQKGDWCIHQCMKK